MMTRELYYGVNVDTNSVSIDPWAVDPSQPSWLFRINNFFVWLSTEKVQLSIPTLEDHWKTWSLTHLQPNAAYYIEDTAGNSQKASSDSEGVLTFDFLHSSSVITCTLTNTQWPQFGFSRIFTKHIFFVAAAFKLFPYMEFSVDPFPKKER